MFRSGRPTVAKPHRFFGFSRFNNPDYVKNATTFKKAAAGVDYTFNWFYADNKDIAFYSSGRLPIRAKGTDTDLPRWGDEWSDGSIHCSQALSRRVVTAMPKQKVSRAQLAGIVEDAATEDVRAKSLLPVLLKTLGNDPKTSTARKLLADWYADGAHRVDRDRTGAYAHQSAIAIFDTWWEDGANALAYDFAASGLGTALAKALPQSLDSHPRLGQGSSWLGSPWYGYIDKDLRKLNGAKVASPFAYPLCGAGKLSVCRKQLRASLLGAVTRDGEAGRH